jgi:hypothetical protein
MVMGGLVVTTLHSTVITGEATRRERGEPGPILLCMGLFS